MSHLKFKPQTVTDSKNAANAPSPITFLYCCAKNGMGNKNGNHKKFMVVPRKGEKFEQRDHI